MDYDPIGIVGWQSGRANLTSQINAFNNINMNKVYLGYDGIVLSDNNLLMMAESFTVDTKGSLAHPVLDTYINTDIIPSTLLSNINYNSSDKWYRQHDYIGAQRPRFSLKSHHRLIKYDIASYDDSTNSILTTISPSATISILPSGDEQSCSTCGLVSPRLQTFRLMIGGNNFAPSYYPNLDIDLQTEGIINPLQDTQDRTRAFPSRTF